MAHAVDQPLVVKGFSVQQFFQILLNFLRISGILHLFAEIVKHSHDLDVRSAVLRPLQRAERRSDRRIGIRAG